MTRTPHLIFLAALLSAVAPVTAQEPPDAGGQSTPKAQQAPPTRPLPFALASFRGEKKIQVDGSLIDWPAAQPILLTDLRQLSGTAHGAWRGPKDLQAQGFIVWDPDNLYIAMVVRDDWHRPLDKVHRDDTEIPPADAVIVMVDPLRDTRSCGPDPGRQEDKAFWLASVGLGKLIQWDRLRGEADFCPGGSLAVARDDEEGLTTYEAQIPWEAILPVGMKAEAGIAVDMQFTVEDYDEVTDTMPQSRVGWTFGVLPWLEPGLRASVILAGPEGLADNLQPPARRKLNVPPLPPRQLFDDLAQALRNNPAVASGNPDVLPPDLGGATRRKALEQLDELLAKFPKVDHQDLHMRSHRRMNREVVAYVRHGLPYFWRLRLAEVAAALDESPPERGVRMFRLPMGGWVIMSKAATFAVDPAGVFVAEALDGRVDFVLLTQPLSIFHRQDELLVRLLSGETGQRVYAHLPMHLPSVRPDRLTIVDLNEPLKNRGVDLLPIAPEFENPEQMPVGLAWSVRMPDGTHLVFAGPQLPEGALANQRVDALILPLDHLAPLGAAQDVAARLTIISDALLATRRAGPQGRHSLKAAHTFQEAAAGFPTILPAPGESLEVLPPE